MPRRREARYTPEFDWRDPNMPVLQPCSDDITGEIALELFDPDLMTKFARESYREANPDTPKRKDDPSYNWSLHARWKKLEQQALKRDENFPLDCLEDCSSPSICITAGCKKAMGG